jgi:hypothetical protein
VNAPDLIERARRIVADVLRSRGDAKRADEVLAGRQDGDLLVKIAIEAACEALSKGRAT